MTWRPDSWRCSAVTAFHGVDMPTSDVAYVCGTQGFIGRTVSATDIWATTVPPGLTATMHGLCFPNGPDTGYAVGSGGTILRTFDGGMPLTVGGIGQALGRVERRIGEYRFR